MSIRLALIWSTTKTALGEVLFPKGRVLRRQTRPGIPAPRYSRRETPINWATRYLGRTKCVKAILAQCDSRPTQKVHSNRKARQGRKEIPYIHKKLPERNRGAVRNVLIQVLPACRLPSAGRGPGGRNLMSLCDLCGLCGEISGITVEVWGSARPRARWPARARR